MASNVERESGGYRGRVADAAPNSRLFIIGGKGVTEDDWKEAFSPYGTIRDIWVMRDKSTNEDKGITYITFSKASEAALAMEEMTGRIIPCHPKPLKVLIASERREGSTRDPKEDEKWVRIFIMIPKDFSEDDVRKEFSVFGDIEYVTILKDKHNGTPKGLAYVKYYRAYHAALALEGCDKKFKPMFATRKGMGRDRDRDRDYPDYDGYSSRSSRDDRSGYSSRDYTSYDYDQYRDFEYNRPQGGPMSLLQGYGSHGTSRLNVMASQMVTPEQLNRLFDLVPGLEYCDFDQASGYGYVKYSTPECASYARDKMDSLEYPPGYRIYVKLADVAAPGAAVDPTRNPQVSGELQQLQQALQSVMSGGDAQTNLQSLMGTIQRATSVIQQAGIPGVSGEATIGGSERVRFCNIPLPPKQPFAPQKASTEERLFIVSQPRDFPQQYLNDVFCRFGNLIEAYFMPGKNYGYAKYANKDSAKRAIDTLHGQEVCNMRIKVILAEPPKHAQDEPPNKRPRN